MSSGCHFQRTNSPNTHKRQKLLSSYLSLVQLTAGKQMSSGFCSKQTECRTGELWWTSRLPALHKKLISQYLEAIQGSLEWKFHTRTIAWWMCMQYSLVDSEFYPDIKKIYLKWICFLCKLIEMEVKFSFLWFMESLVYY